MFNSIQKRLVFSFVVITTISVCLISWYTWYKSGERFISEIKAQSHDNLVMIAGEIKSQLSWVVKDILFLRDLLHESGMCDTVPVNASEFSNIKSVLHSFTSLARNHQIYDQVRYLNETGKEIIRVDYKDDRTSIIPEEKLQDKRHRYYFKEAMKLDRGKIYISPMDLNIEHRSIETPLIPTIRFATPIFNRQNENRGIIVLNVRADFVYAILEKNRLSFVDLNKHYYLVNAKGYFLFHPDKQFRFGFMRPDGKTLAGLFPELRVFSTAKAA